MPGISEGSPPRHGRLAIPHVLDPSGAETVTAWLSHTELDYWRKHRPAAYWSMRSMVAVLRAPKRIYYGTRALDDERGWCYVGWTATYQDADNCTRDLANNRIWLVFMNFQCDVTGFRKEQADNPAGRFLPIDALGRFEKLIWQAPNI